ncbi:MAG: methionine--tRNA ligase [Phycisphaerales bacterium]|nr:methionine--tRNA ligase [Phycisphaerales bacterium]
MSQPYYITTPIYYVNDRPHIGHCYTTTVADVAARFARLMGRDTFLLTGTDEHAEKVVKTAQDRGLTPLQWADKNAAEFVKAFDLMGIQADDFMRTSQPRHIARASAYIKKLMDSGDIYLGDYVGWFDASQEEYLTETVAKEHDYKSPVTGKPLEKRTEKNYFFRLSKYESALLQAIEKGAKGEPGGYRILPDARRNEVLGRLKQGLNDVPVSRAVKEGDADWGILMPGDPNHRVYVWIEALCNYLSAVDNEREPSTAQAEGGPRRKYWPPAVHVMAKDILWFHAVVWPAMLMALGEELPAVVYAHAYFVAEGRKMSKSLGNFIEIDQLRAYADKFSVDAVRWYLATQGPLGANDADFAHAKFIEVYNADLANGIGNCASRVGNMIAKYFDGVVPEPAERAAQIDQKQWDALFLFPGLVKDCAPGIATQIEACGIDQALHLGASYVNAIDQFIAAHRPFSVAKEEPSAGYGPLNGFITNQQFLSTVLYHSAEAVRIASLLLFPALPNKMAELWRNWNCSPLNDPADPNSGFKAPLAELAEWGGKWSLKPGQKIDKGEALFMRADPKEPAPGQA